MSDSCDAPDPEVISSTTKFLEALEAKFALKDPAAFESSKWSTPTLEAPLDAESGKASVKKDAAPAGASVAIPHVTIDDAAMDKELDDNLVAYTTGALPPDWAQTYHYRAADPTDEKQATLLAQYVLVLDSLNFCFWPLPGYEYEHLASSLKRTLENDPTAFSADRLIALTEEELTRWLQPPPEFPLIGEAAAAAGAGRVLPIPLVSTRTRLLREVGTALKACFEGQAAALVRAAKGSAIKLVRLVTTAFPGFRDQAQFAGEQVFFYKRAQIFVGDVWGAFGGKVGG